MIVPNLKYLFAFITNSKLTINLKLFHLVRLRNSNRKTGIELTLLRVLSIEIPNIIIENLTTFSSINMTRVIWKNGSGKNFRCINYKSLCVFPNLSKLSEFCETTLLSKCSFLPFLQLILVDVVIMILVRTDNFHNLRVFGTRLLIHVN